MRSEIQGPPLLLLVLSSLNPFAPRPKWVIVNEALLAILDMMTLLSTPKACEGLFLDLLGETN